ncbi:hypothetical protein MKW92_047433 [Papaver armeniacum]|nr:hypothetical protein MKW92_047433 [Papaver armeniacum]
MRNQVPPSSDEEYDNHSDILSPTKEFDENGNLKLYYNNIPITDLTPRLKVIREMERLALIAMKVWDDLRHKLLSYRSGDFWLPIVGIKKEEMDISPVITILLVDSLVLAKALLLILCMVFLADLVSFLSLILQYKSTFMEEHNVLRSMRSGFCVYDSIGLDYSQLGESLKHHQLYHRPGVLEESLASEPTMPSTSRFVRRRRFTKAFLNGDSKPLESTRELLYATSIRKSKERIDGRIKICEFLGVSETSGAYDIVCLTEHGILAEESDPITAYALTEAIYRALIFSDRTHSPKSAFMDYFLDFLNLIICFVAGMFTYLAHFFTQLADPSKLKRM